MTIREYLNDHLRRATLFCWAGTAAGIVAVFSAGHRYALTIALVVGAVLYALAYYYTFSARCGRCHTQLLFELGSFGIRLRLPIWYQSCPSCGLSFDAQRDEHAKA